MGVDARRRLKQNQNSLAKRGVRHLDQARCKWGNVQEPTALKAFLDSPPADVQCMEEIGLAMIDIRPLTGRILGTDASMPRRWVGSSGVSKTQPTTLRKSTAIALPPLMGASPDAMLRFEDGSRAAVEVKNVCPFFRNENALAIVSGSSANSRLPKQKIRGPATSISPHQLPQIQWEMLATGVGFNYLVSASAQHGMNVFIVQRDQRYLDLMLSLISEFYAEFVLAKHPPAADFFWGRPHYQEFLQLTLDICATTFVNCTLPSICDIRKEAPFLDDVGS